MASLEDSDDLSREWQENIFTRELLENLSILGSECRHHPLLDFVNIEYEVDEQGRLVFQNGYLVARNFSFYSGTFLDYYRTKVRGRPIDSHEEALFVFKAYLSAEVASLSDNILRKELDNSYRMLEVLNPEDPLLQFGEKIGGKVCVKNPKRLFQYVEINLLEEMTAAKSELDEDFEEGFFYAEFYCSELKNRIRQLGREKRSRDFNPRAYMGDTEFNVNNGLEVLLSQIDFKDSD